MIAPPGFVHETWKLLKGIRRWNREGPGWGWKRWRSFQPGRGSGEGEAVWFRQGKKEDGGAHPRRNRGYAGPPRPRRSGDWPLLCGCGGGEPGHSPRSRLQERSEKGLSSPIPHDAVTLTGYSPQNEPSTSRKKRGVPLKRCPPGCGRKTKKLFRKEDKEDTVRIRDRPQENQTIPARTTRLRPFCLAR